jgi:transposase
VEIILGEARRRWNEAEKKALIAETFVEGETVHGVARRHNINPSMLFSWRRQYRAALTHPAPSEPARGFAPVALAAPEQAVAPAPSADATEAPLIEAEFGGGVKLRILGAVDPELAAAVTKALARR